MIPRYHSPTCAPSPFPVAQQPSIAVEKVVHFFLLIFHSCNSVGLTLPGVGNSWSHGTSWVLGKRTRPMGQTG